MGTIDPEFESFEQQFLELIGVYKSINISEARLRDALRTETNRADAAEIAKSAAEQTVKEARASAAAATAGATQASATLARVQDELTAAKMQLEIADRQRVLLEERCSEQSMQHAAVERELEKLRPLQSSYPNLQRQYQELQERIRNATDAARNESSRLEGELRRVERCASGGTELRERARLAAAAHARERRLVAAELQHTSRELLAANAEVARLNVIVTDMQRSGAHDDSFSKPKTISESDSEALAAFKAERAGAVKLERALAAAVKDNAELAAKLHSEDAAAACEQSAMPNSPEEAAVCAISALDSFLAD